LSFIFQIVKGKIRKGHQDSKSKNIAFLKELVDFLFSQKNGVRKKNELISGGLFFSLLLHPWVF